MRTAEDLLTAPLDYCPLKYEDDEERPRWQTLVNQVDKQSRHNWRWLKWRLRHYWHIPTTVADLHEERCWMTLQFQRRHRRAHAFWRQLPLFGFLVWYAMAIFLLLFLLDWADRSPSAALSLLRWATSCLLGVLWMVTGAIASFWFDTVEKRVRRRAAWQATAARVRLRYLRERQTGQLQTEATAESLSPAERLTGVEAERGISLPELAG